MPNVFLAGVLCSYQIREKDRPMISVHHRDPKGVIRREPRLELFHFPDSCCCSETEAFEIITSDLIIRNIGSGLLNSKVFK